MRPPGGCARQAIALGVWGAWLLPAAGLWLLSALFYDVAAVSALVLLLGVTLLRPKGRRGWVFVALLTGVDAALLVLVFWLRPGFPCPWENKHLRWLDRSGPAYDALWVNDRQVLVGRRSGGGHGGLALWRKGGGLRDLAPARTVEGLLLLPNRRLVATDWGGDRLVSLKAGGRPYLDNLCRWPIDLKSWGEKLLVLCERDRQLMVLSGWPPKRERVIVLPRQITNPYGLAVNAASDVAWVSSWGTGGGLGRVQLSTGAVRVQATPGAAMGLLRVPSRGELWLAQPLAAGVLRLEENTLKPLGRLPTGMGARRLALNGRWVGVVNYFDGTFEAWDTVTLKKRLTVKVGRLARGVRPAPGGFLVCSGCGVGRVWLDERR